MEATAKMNGKGLDGKSCPGENSIMDGSSKEDF